MKKKFTYIHAFFKCPDRFLFAIANFEPPSPPKKVNNEIYSLVLINASWGKCKLSWSNDDLESFLKIRALCESIRSQGAMADMVNLEQNVPLSDRVNTSRIFFENAFHSNTNRFLKT